jgi:hypothetical protein
MINRQWLPSSVARLELTAIASKQTAAFAAAREANMQAHPLEPFFQQAVRNSYEGKLGLHDPDVTSYVAHLLCEFAESDNLYKVRDAAGRPIAELTELMLAADPVHGTASSFDAERAVRKHIGDYALFVAGMYPEGSDPGLRYRRHRPTLGELILAGKQSYFIVSQFNLCEYEREALHSRPHAGARRDGSAQAAAIARAGELAFLIR